MVLPSPPVVMAGDTNSVAIASAFGSAKSSFRSLTNVECQSPVTNTGLRTPDSTTLRRAAAGPTGSRPSIVPEPVRLNRVVAERQPGKEAIAAQERQRHAAGDAGPGVTQESPAVDAGGQGFGRAAHVGRPSVALAQRCCAALRRSARTHDGLSRRQIGDALASVSYRD